MTEKMEKSRKTKKQVIRAICGILTFMIVFFLIYKPVSRIFEEKMSKNHRLYECFSMDRNSLDMILVGSSHIHYGLSPMKLWEEQGITSCVASSQSQSIPCSYYVMKEMIRRQHPKVIVLDTYYMVYNIYARDQALLHVATDPMPLTSPVRYEMIFDLVPKVEGNEDVWSFLFTLGLYHYRWETLEHTDFYPKNQFAKGFSAEAQKVKIEKTEMPETPGKIPDISEDYLDRIIQLCNEENVKLLLIEVPYHIQGVQTTENLAYHLGVFRALEDYAAENDVPYINFFRDQEGIEWDYSGDFFEPAHLNMYGAEKVTSYLGRYVREHYEMPDHRTDPAYQKWNEDLKEYHAYIQEKIKKEKKRIEKKKKKLEKTKMKMRELEKEIKEAE